ncbi:hypothetical protein N0V85_007416 [Neurospora sp. IMI 360204]|nr:hypothetical protein N0V85_007416 [Neurospora sp. IMI 360204]
MSTDDLPSNIVPLESGLSLRFYEAVLFLYCLKEVKYKAESVKEPDLESDSGRSSRDSFRCFVNKLGQICDNGSKGKTVTAFAVLQPGQIQYRFASNQRTSEELEDVKTYIANILGFLGSAADDQLNGVFGTVLERILAFNRPAIEKKLCASAQEEEPSLESFVSQTRELLDTIGQLHNSFFEGFIRDKAQADRDPANKTPWSELRHAFGRLHSYTIAVKVLISMRRRRRELFEDFEVVAVLSSVRSGCPNVRRAVDGILKRFPEKMKMAEAYNANLPEEQQKAMTDKIKAYGTGSKGKFRPYVHAELLLLDSILTEQREGVTLRFFGEADYDRYIGCSKPTCRLCKLYIDSHPSGVEFRGGHGNIYHAWRAPDIYNEDGVNVAEARRTRQDIHNKMLETLRQTIKRWITGHVAERKHHDSNSSPTSYIGAGSSTSYNPHLAAQAFPDSMDSISTRGAMDDSDDVATAFGRMSIAGDSGRSSSSPSISRSSQETTPVPERNVGSPFASSGDLKPSINRRQRPLIIEDEE